MFAFLPHAEIWGPGLVGVALAFAAYFFKHGRDVRLAAEEWRERLPMDDDEFVRACGIPEVSWRADVALAARRVIGELASVPPETIYPDDSFVQDLVRLPFWDHADWRGFLRVVEERLDGCVRLDEASIDHAMRQGRRDSFDLRVRHVVRAVTMGAYE